MRRNLLALLFVLLLAVPSAAQLGVCSVTPATVPTGSIVRADFNLVAQSTIELCQIDVESFSTACSDDELLVASGGALTCSDVLTLSGADISAGVLGLPSGATTPGTCVVGEIFFDNDETAGENLYVCTATDTWTQISGSSSVGFDTITTGTNTTATMTVGTGGTLATSGSGAIVATTSAALAANGGNCSAGEWSAGVDAAGVAEGCTADDDVPESGDFGAAVDLESDGSLSADVVAAAELADADWGDVSISGGVATVDSGAVGVTELADDATCAALEVVARNAGDTAFECQAVGASPGFDDIASGTNTTAAMVVGAGASLAIASTGTIDASALDHDGDGTRSVVADADSVDFDTNDDAAVDVSIRDGHLCLNSGCTVGTLMSNGDTRMNFQMGGANVFVLRGGQADTALPWGTNSAGGVTRYDLTPSTSVSVFELGFATASGLGGTSTDVRIMQGAASGVGVTSTEVDLYKIIDHAEQSVTCTDSGDGSPGSLVPAPTTSYLEITNSDPHGCDVTLSETGAAKGRTVELRVISTAGGTVNFATAAGIQQMPATCSLNLYGQMTARYLADRWAQTTCTTF